jgi:hypothetical protein
MQQAGAITHNRGKLDFSGKLVACNVETGIYLCI